jgi:drug/metabolite transporter (DMT)-like permease
MIIGLTFLIVFELIADIFAKEYSIHLNWKYGGMAILSYIIANSFWLFALKNGSGLARGAIIFGVSSAIIAAVIGMAVYKEPLSVYQQIGIGFGLVSLAFLTVV